MNSQTINWPAKYHPDNSAIHVVNELNMDGSSEMVWDRLVRATEWPEYYPNASNVRILTGSKQKLEKGTQFRWKTFGVTIDTNVVEFEPFKRLAWEANSLGMQVYHAWLITSKANGCHVVTEETQNGFLPRIANVLKPGNIYKHHQIWLEALNEASR